MRWEELTSPEIDALDRDRTVLVLPVGSVEQHGRHMPLGTDTMLAACRRRWRRPTARRAASRSCRRPGTASRPITCAFPARSRSRAETMMALVEDIVGERRRARLPPHRSSSTAMAAMPASSTCSPRRSATASTARRGSPASPISSSRATRSPSCASREPGGMGHACEFETSMMQHLRPELVRSSERAAICYPDPGSRLSHHRPARRLGGPHLSRLRRPLARAARSAIPSLATRREGRALPRRGRRRARRLHRGFRELADSRRRSDMSGALARRRHRARLFRRAPCQRSIASCRRAELVAVCDRDRERAPADCRARPAREAYHRLPRAARAPRHRRGQHLPAGPRCTRTRRSRRRRPARRSSSKSRSPMTPRTRAGSSTRSRRTASA